jgi:formyltetrahydrofolate-dependent phosphoribosylglycinamide formyltransferase
MNQTPTSLKLAILISGGGTTMTNIARCIEASELDAKIVCVIASNGKAGGIERARKLGVEPQVIVRKHFESVEAFSGAVFNAILHSGADLVCLGGFLSLLRIPDEYLGRVMNIHPALLPSFGGQGMYGHHVHEAVLAAGCKVSGCTVHFADNQYDRGPIIVQRCCAVEESDDADALAARVFEQECLAYPQAIRLFAAGRLTIVDGRVAIRQ